MEKRTMQLQPCPAATRPQKLISPVMRQTLSKASEYGYRVEVREQKGVTVLRFRRKN